MTILHSASPKIMGILNLTPDSFSDGGRYHQLDQALAQAERMLSELKDLLERIETGSAAETEQLVPRLREMGVSGIFGPGTTKTGVLEYLDSLPPRQRG